MDKQPLNSKYTANRADGDCVIAGIHNVLVWAGGDRDYTLIGHVCHIDPEYGLRASKSSQHVFTKTLRLLTSPWLTLQIRKNPTVKIINNCLTSGGGVLLLYMTDHNAAHAVFISKKTPNNYVIWNHLYGTPEKCGLRGYIPHRELTSMLSLTQNPAATLPRAFLFHRRLT